MTVEIVEEEDDGPAMKKHKASAAEGPIIEEVEDVDMPSGSPVSPIKPSEIIEAAEDGSTQLNGTAPSSPVSPQSSSRTFFGVSKSSIPKEPSKLRFSIKADREEKEESGSGSSEGKRDGMADVKALPLSELPTTVFRDFTTRNDGPRIASSESKAAVSRLDQSELPLHDDFKLGGAPSPPPPPAPAKGGFNWGAAGMKAPAPVTSGWSCSTCMCSNPSGADICTVCETPRA